jgi:hypothetical protein
MELKKIKHTNSITHQQGGCPMSMIHFHSARKSQSIKIGNRFFHYMANFNYLGKAYTVHEKFKSILNTGHACYYSIQNSLYAHLLSIHAKT